MTTGQAEAVNSSFDAALALHQAGRLAEARRIYEAVLARDPAHFDALHMLGVVCVQSGETERGAALIEQAIGLSPQIAAAHVNLAMALSALGRFEAAIESCERALALEPDSAGAHSNRGNALMAVRRFQDALASYDRVVALAPSYPEAHYNRANALRELRRLGAALASFERAIALRPTYIEALNNRAGVFAALGRSEEALAAYEAAIAMRPDSAEAHANRAKILNDLWRSDEALAASERAIALQPEAEGLNNRGVALHELGRAEEAMATWTQVVALRPDHAKAHNNIGMALQTLGRPAEAVAAYDRALALAPDFSEAHLNRASSLLSLGDLPGGFEEYRWRWVAPDGPRLKRRLPCPLWEGESLAGKAILVHCEQGYGDALQFVRFAPLLARTAARVTVLADPPLVTLLRSIPGIEVTDRVTDEAAYDFQVPLLCAPRLLGTTLETIPGETPYLFPDPAKAAAWARRLPRPGEALRVGLVWAGGTRNDAPSLHAIDRRRSVRLEQYARLGEIAGARFFSLQKDGPAAQARRPPAGLDLTDWTPELRDFADTAALVAGLDLVITVDTSVAHLAGALGKPVWVLSRFDGCWRWLNGREDSPWYPTARIFHQKAPGAWDEVMDRVAGELAALSAARNQGMSKQGGGDRA